MTSGVEAVRSRISTNLAGLFRRELTPALRDRLNVHLPHFILNDHGIIKLFITPVAESLLRDTELSLKGPKLGAEDILCLLRTFETEEVITGGNVGELIRHLGLDTAYEPMVREELRLLDRVVAAELSASKQDAIADALSGLNAADIGIDPKTRAFSLEYASKQRHEILLHCILQILGYRDIRCYDVTLKDGKWIWRQFLEDGNTRPSRFATEQGDVTEEQEAKSFLLKLRETSSEAIEQELSRGLYQVKINDKSIIMHVPNRKNCYFESPTRIEEDEAFYETLHGEKGSGKDKCNELMFMLVGDVKGGKNFKVYQMTNWAGGEQLISNWEKDSRLLMGLAKALRAAEERDLAESEKQTLIIEDDLTKLYNRRYFDRTLKREISRLSRPRPGVVLSMIMGDIDDFKLVNDTYGHAVGDRVLKAVAEIFREEVRDGDVPARYGGEELAVICSETNAEGASRLAERIRVRVAALTWNDLPNLRVTISFGVASCSIEEISSMKQRLTAGDMIEDLTIVKRADDKLYQAKRGIHHQPKKNQVVA